MIFENDRIVSVGYKVTNHTDWSLDGIKLVLSNIFIGLYNQEEILKALKLATTHDLKELFTSCGLCTWLHTSLDGDVMINQDIINMLELDETEPFKCVEIDPMYRSGVLYHNDVKDGLKSVTNKFTDLIKEVNNQ